MFKSAPTSSKSPERPKLAYSSSGSRRMRVAYTHDMEGGGVREIWVTFSPVKHELGYKPRGYLYDDPEKTGTEHTVSESKGWINYETFIKEIEEGTGNGEYWRIKARALWKAQFGEIKPMPKKNPGAAQQSTKKNEKKRIDTNVPSETEPPTPRMSTPHDTNVTAKRPADQPVEHSSNKRQKLSNLDTNEALDQWHDLAKGVSLQVVSAMRSVLKEQVRTQELPPAELLENIRTTAQNMFNSDTSIKAKVMYMDPAWTTWIEKVKKVPQEPIVDQDAATPNNSTTMDEVLDGLLRWCSRVEKLS